MSQSGKNIKIVGVGGGGSNVVCKMVKESYLDSEFITFNTLHSAFEIAKKELGIKNLFLRNVCAPMSYFVPTMNDFNYYYSDQDQRENVINTIINGDGTHLIIVTGIAGGWSKVATEWLCMLAKQKNITVTVVCTIPFLFEGETKKSRALEAINDLEDYGVDVFPINSNVLNEKYNDLNLFNCFEYLDEYMAEKVKEIYNIITTNSGDQSGMVNEISQIAPSCDLGLDIFDRNGRMTTGCVAVEREEDESSEAPVNGVPIIGVSRHRIGTDGDGITTLVAFHGCPLRCKFCLNPECWNDVNNYKHYTPQSLYDEIKIDDIYFRTTGGGVTFGGGEPCLQADLL